MTNSHTDVPAGAALVVAIDGPAGSGKSTVARGVATQLHLRYVDTGAMYRALTWLALETGVALDDPVALTALAERFDLSIGTTPDRPSVRVGDSDVTTAIRTRTVTNAVSAVSAVPGVRTRLLAFQRRLVGTDGGVVEGRDIGTVVFPEAPVKVFLTASGDARALRRARETAGVSPAPVHDLLELTRVEIDRRDERDSTRVTSPLAKASDAVEIDTTAMPVDRVIDVVVQRCRTVQATGAARS